MRQEKLSELLDISIGRTPSRSEPSYWGKGYRWVSIRDLSSKIVTETKEQITNRAVTDARCKIVKKGTLLFSFKLSIGKMAFAGCDLFTNEAIAAFAIKDEKQLNPEFLYYALQSATYGGSNQAVMGKTLNSKSLAAIKIPLPPLDDQIRIAHLLGKVEKLIAKRKQGLKQLDELISSVFLEMFGDPVINDNGWDKPEFSAIILSMRNGLSPSKAGKHKGRVYTLSAITGDSFREIFKQDIFSQIHQKYYPTPNDFLLCRGNGNLSLVGKGYFFPSVSTDVIFPDTIIAVSIQPDSINRAFFEALWKTKFIRQQIENNARTTNGAHKVNQSVIENIKIIRPPMDLQDQFATIVKKVESVRSLYLQSLTDLECLCGALSQQAFNGELDLSQVLVPILPTQGVTTVSQGEPVTMLGPVEQTVSAILLPDSGNLQAALENAEARNTLIAEWLEAYRVQLADSPFSLQYFMELAQSRLAEIHPDNNFVLGTSDFEYIKAWVFEALAIGKLTQIFDDSANCIELKSTI